MTVSLIKFCYRNHQLRKLLHAGFGKIVNGFKSEICIYPGKVKSRRQVDKLLKRHGQEGTQP